MADIEQTAREMGWRPKEEFRGEESKWVDAETFVSRGEHYLPIIKADRDRLRNQVADLSAQQHTLTQTLVAAQEAIEELREFGAEQTKRQVEAARRDLAAQLKQAREDGDTEAEVRILTGLQDLKDAKASAPAPTPAPASAPAAPRPDPVLEAWIGKNTWFKEKPRLRGLALGITDELKAANPSLAGAEFFEALDREMEKYLEPPTRSTSKVNGGRPSGGGSGGGGSKAARTYDDLPAEAKEACDRQALKLVGPGRAFKDKEAQRAHYVTHFFAGETA